jgi:hypothetical protein
LGKREEMGQGLFLFLFLTGSFLNSKLYPFVTLMKVKV